MKMDRAIDWSFYYFCINILHKEEGDIAFESDWNEYVKYKEERK